MQFLAIQPRNDEDAARFAAGLVASTPTEPEMHTVWEQLAVAMEIQTP